LIVDSNLSPEFVRNAVKAVADKSTGQFGASDTAQARRMVDQILMGYDRADKALLKMFAAGFRMGI